MNTELLLKVRDAILAEPLKFDMDSYANRNAKSPCGTTACIAGHAVAIDRNHKSLKTLLRILGPDGMDTDKVEELAEEAIGISNPESNRLFYRFWWPHPFDEQYEDAKTSKGRARVAARRINHFIETGK